MVMVMEMLLSLKKGGSKLCDKSILFCLLSSYCSMSFLSHLWKGGENIFFNPDLNVWVQSNTFLNQWRKCLKLFLFTCMGTNARYAVCNQWQAASWEGCMRIQIWGGGGHFEPKLVLSLKLHSFFYVMTAKLSLCALRQAKT